MNFLLSNFLMPTSMNNYPAQNHAGKAHGSCIINTPPVNNERLPKKQQARHEHHAGPVSSLPEPPGKLFLPVIS
jgi:hypothetical protein